MNFVKPKMKTFYLNLSKFQNKRIVKTEFKSNVIPSYIPKPSCKNCLYCVNINFDQLNNFPNSNVMVCTLFKYKFAPILYDYTQYAETHICRLDENLCGHDGKYFKEK